MSVGSFVSARDYRDYGGWGTSSPDELAELRKALTAGSDVNDPGVAPGVGFPLRTESLEAQLKNLTFEMSEIKLFRSIAKVPASNTVEEFNRLVSYSRSGSRRFNMGWMSEGALPEEEDSTYERVTVLTKYLGVVGRVTHVANTIRAAHGNVIALETMNKTMDLLKNLENALFFGNSSLIPEQVDGLEKLITDAAPDNVVDLRGAALTEGAMNDMLLQIRQNYGMGTDAYFSAGAFSDLAKQVYERQRFALAPAPGTLGTTVTAFQGQHGRINLHDHVFFEDEQSSLAAGLGDSSKAPLTPTITVAPAAAGTGSQFIAADIGVYIYQVVGGNKYGLSTPVDTAGVTVAVGENVTFTVGDGGQGTTFYEIYRSDVGGAVGTAKLMTRVSRTGATQVITDTNADIPGTTKGFVLQQNQRSMAWAQLLPMTRVPLATIDTSIRWAQVVYGAIKLYTPARNIVVKNIGREPGSL
jgi:hypothetical protein